MASQPGREWKVDPVEARVLGLPTRWFGAGSGRDVSGARHPYRWARWRIERHRLGPYAPPFDPKRTSR